MIQINHLRKTYNKGRTIALEDVTLHIPAGEIFGLIGPDGAGKTTLFRLLATLLLPDSGKAQVNGLDVVRDYRQIRRCIGYMPGRFSLYQDLTVEENFRLFGGIYGMKRRPIKEQFQRWMQRLGMEHAAHKQVGALPLGWKQKLAFAVSIFHRPSIVFLDEPTGGVDAQTRRQFWQLIYEAAEEGITIFVTTHYMDEAAYCDRVSIMVDGQIRALDTPQRLMEQFGAADMYGVFFALARTAQRS